MKTLVLFVCCFIACLSVKSQTLVGSWTGELEVGLQKLRLVFRLDTNAQGIPVGFFDSPDEVPRRAVTMGMISIMQAKKILLVANGPAKKEILTRAFEGPITPQIPASILQLHPDITVIYSEV